MRPGNVASLPWIHLEDTYLGTTFIYIHTRTPADVSPLYYPPPDVFLGVTLLYNLS